MQYNECLEKALEISKAFHNEINKSIDFCQEKFFIEYPDINNLNKIDPKFIIVLGLNPSSSGENKKRNPNLFGYIPEVYRENEIEGDKNIRKEIFAKKVVYQPYFKTFIEELMCFDYFPIWYNYKIMDSILNEFCNLFSDKQKEYLKHFRNYDNGKYIIYVELIHYAETNSKNIIPLLNNKDISKKIKEYIQLIIDYFKPKVVLSANASVSHFLIKQINNDIFSTEIEYNKCKIFLGSMLTGQRAMDIYSRKRLMNDIFKYLFN